MATTTELLTYNSRECGLILLFDSVQTALTDNADLVGFSTGGGHTVRLGLQREGLSCKLAINYRDGQWLDSPATFPIVDFTGDLDTLFAAVSTDERSLGDVPIGGGLPIHPSTDLSGRPDLDNMNIGLERVGSNGERHRYAVPPTFNIGLEHTITVSSLDLAGAPVTASPIVWVGRRCALYLLFRDRVTYPDRDAGAASWRPFSEARRIWCGTLKDQGEVSGHEWTFDGDGPGSMLRKPLATSFSPTPLRCVGDVTLEDGERGVYAALRTSGAFYGVRNYVVNISGTTTDAIRDEVIAEIDACAAAAGTDGVWNAQAGCFVAMTQDGGVAITIPNAADPLINVGELELNLHRKVWSLLGYDVDAQRQLYPDPEDTRAVQFFANVNSPGDDYWTAVFKTGEEGWPDHGDNEGKPRNYSPLYLGGTTVLLAGLNGGQGQVIRLGDNVLGGGSTSTSVAHPGQLAWPVASSPTDPTAPIAIAGIGNCNRCGWWLFIGKRRFTGLTGSAAEVFDERWIGLANWVNGGGQQDGLVSGDTIIVTHWFDPRQFGYRTKSTILDITQDWIARDEASPEEGQIQAIPLVMLGYHSAPDLAHIVLQRLLHTTGTSTGWSSFELNSPTLTGGTNNPAGIPDAYARDAEIADLGLAIPDEWIASPAAFAAAANNVENDAILDVKFGFTAGMPAEDVIRSLMQPVGWAWHFRDGQFGIWCPADGLTLGDATVVLDRSGPRVEKHSNAGKVRLAQQLRRWQPVDRWKLATDYQPLERKTTPIERQAPDPQLRYRPGDVPMSILAHGMRVGGSGLAERLLLMSRWFAMRHFEVKGYPVQALTPGLDCWPGTVVRITDPELVDPSTGYQVTNRLAIITGTTRTFGTNEMAMTLDLLVLGTPTSTPRINAPIGQGRGYNSATGRLYLQDDWAGVGNGWSDATAFAEQTYTGIAALGGNAVIECWQWDGVTFSQTFSGTVTSVSTTVGDAYLVLTSTSGTYYRDMDTWVVLRPSTINNAAWVEARHSPIGNNAGVWTDDAAASQTVLTWEV